MDELLGLVRYALGCVLAFAALAKIRDFGAFSRSLGAYGLHRMVGRASACALIGAEALAAFLCFSLAADATVGVVSSGLGVGFTGAQTYLLSAGTRAACLCFGAASAEPVSPRSWTRAALVLAAGLVLLFFGSGNTRPVDPPLAAAGLALVAALVLWDRRGRAAPGPFPGRDGSTSHRHPQV